MTIPTRLGPVSCAVAGGGPPLVLLHANPGDARDFDGVLPVLAGRYRTVAVDWPGYGRSPAADPRAVSAPGYADALEDVVDRLGLDHPGLIGNSVGGYAAARLAVRRPGRVAALVLVNGGGFTPHTRLTRLFCRAKGAEWVTRLAARPLAGHTLRGRTPVVAGMLARAAAGRRDRARAATDAAVWRSFASPEHDLRTAARRITAPTLLAWGRHDPLLPLARDGRSALACIPGAELAAFDTGHSPFAEAPGEFLRVVGPFLARHLGPRPPSRSGPPGEGG